MIRIIPLIVLLMGLLTSVRAQDVEFGVNTFATSYVGELNNSLNWASNIRYGSGFHVRRNINPWWSVRSDANWAIIAGADNREDRISNYRNLSFRSAVFEITALAEYRIRPITIFPSRHRMTPYVAAGFHLFHFDPQAKYKGEWYDLAPLSLEGQGLAEYPDRKPYSLAQIGIPVAVGMRWASRQNLRIALEAGYRFTFTDYLDDVGGFYANPAVVASNKGAIAGALADRRSELNTAQSFLEPAEVGSFRGSPRWNDGYVFVGLSFSYVRFRSSCPVITP
ncbi:MAG: hypothetical protein FJ344_02040 [Sphingomonadales bacterium]|nr:hypothetical protein [Sphingomonadales bacterium]